LKHYDASTAAPLLPLDLWLSGPELLRGVPAGLAGWLTATGLLTERIRAAAGAPPSVRVVEERLGFLTGEQQVLLEAPAASCFVRQVELLGAGRPWVFAESLVPDHTLELHPWLAELGDSSLGATLAGIPGVSRGPLEFAPLPAAHPLAASALGRLARAPDVVWARRSWFALRGRRLLVQEVLLAEPDRC
jgi:chorismate lyase